MPRGKVTLSEADLVNPLLLLASPLLTLITIQMARFKEMVEKFGAKYTFEVIIEYTQVGRHPDGETPQSVTICYWLPMNSLCH